MYNNDKVTFPHFRNTLLANLKEKFNIELRAGLHKGLLNTHTDILELEHHDCAGFVQTLQAAILKTPEYVVAVSPSKEIFKEPVVTTAVELLAKSGTFLIFIENYPEDFQRHEPSVMIIESDSTQGAKVLAGYISSFLVKGNSVLLINGPQDSENAKLRKQVFLSELEAKFDVQSKDMHGWSQAETEEFVRRSFKRQRKQYDMIICGNDMMALSAVKAVRELSPDWRKCPKVCGYDGLGRAIMCISEQMNPFFATIAIPPSAFGTTAATEIVQRSKNPHWRYVAKRKIHISQENLVDSRRANSHLENEVWAL